MIRNVFFLLCLCSSLSSLAQTRHQGRHDDRLLVGTQSWFNTSDQKIAEVNFTEQGELIGFKTWDEKGLLIDDERMDPGRKRVEIPENLELTYLENGLGFLIIHGRADNDAPNARVGDRVSVHYELFLQDLTLIQETYTKKPFRFKFGENEVIPGFEQAVAMLKVGEEGYFYVPAEMAYGANVVGSIPPFSNLLYRIKFVDLN